MEVFCCLQTNTNFLLYKTLPCRDFLFAANFSIFDLIVQ
jgi:hypothetical protein